jgi:hypothetical protein
MQATSYEASAGFDLDRAIRLNQYYSQKLGWRQKAGAALHAFLGLPSQFGWKELSVAVARWQKNQGLQADGIIGNTTWAKIQALLSRAAAPVKPADVAPKGDSSAAADAPALLQALRPLAAPETAPTIPNALSIVRLISTYQGIPWKICYTVLQHEGGVRLIKHKDGVMQTTDGVRSAMIPQFPRPLMLALLGLDEREQASTAALGQRLQREFARRLAVQIATGVQELYDNLRKFSGYVALAYQAYNAGSGWAAWTATLKQSKVRPKGLSDAEWEENCRRGASILHQPVSGLRISTGIWQCDYNIPAWFSHIPVFDEGTGMQLIAFKYLRSIRECIRQNKPTTPCIKQNHAKRAAGSGPEVCKQTRPGALDKLYDPKLLSGYYLAAKDELEAMRDDGCALKVINGRLIKKPPFAGIGKSP